MILGRLKEMDAIECQRPGGAFYVFPNIKKCLGGKIKNSMDFSMALLEKARVAVVPGIDFGMDGHIRISYACSEETIAEGMDRLEGYLKSLGK
jgi:aspartate aminotransferase